MPFELGKLSPENNNRLDTFIERKDRKKGEKHLRESISFDRLYELARCMLPLDDIATELGISRHTLNRWVGGDWPEVMTRIKEGYSRTRLDLGKTQLDMALNGNPTMLIWLGKQYLGQSERQKVETTTEINITVQKAMEELRTIPRGKLLESLAVMNAPAIEHEAQAESSHEAGDEGGGTPVGK